MISQSEGYLLLLFYGIVVIVLTILIDRKTRHKLSSFLVANRKVGLFVGAFSIASSWIWAPALFVSSQKAFEQGLPGIFWFTVPNILTLIIFAPLALRIRRLMPEGYTLPEYIKKRFDTKTHVIYLFSFFSLQICSFAVQILAGAKMINIISGIEYWIVALIIVISVLLYTLISGLRASVHTDFLQMVLILLAIFTIVPLVFIKTGGISTVLGGIGGVSGKFRDVFDPYVAYSFGIVVTIGLLAGPIGDQQHWQRAFAIKRKLVWKAFILGALVFGIVPIMLSFLGFIAANPAIGQGWEIADTQMVGIIAVANLLPKIFLLFFVIMLFSGLYSTLDSILCAASSLSAIDIFKTYISKDAPKAQILNFARISMILVSFFGLLISLIPGMKILYLFLFYGTLRASTMIPTILSLFWKKVNTNGVFYGVLFALLVGLPIFTLGNMLKIVSFQVLGSLLTIGISSAFVIIFTLIKPQKFDWNVFKSLNLRRT